MLFLAFVLSALALPEALYQSEFTKYVHQYKKSYSRDEFFFRYNVFKKALDIITEHNKDTTAHFTLGVNDFADLTQDEFAATHLGLKGIDHPFLSGKNMFQAKSEFSPLDSFDWREKGVVSPVKDQRQCGSCWAFSATGAMESAVAIKKGAAPEQLSEQQLVDCSWSYGNEGCNGGLPSNAYEYVIAKKGLCSETAYPYTGRDGSCKTCTAISTISGYKEIVGEANILQAAHAQPVSIAIEADRSCFQYYKSGVLTKDKCNCGTSLDHAVLAVGWGTDAGVDYWWVKNSWGTSWGDKGYIRFQRGVGMCGIGQKWNCVPNA